MRRTRDLLKNIRNRSRSCSTFISFHKPPAASFSSASSSSSSSSVSASQMDPSERYSFNPILQWNPHVEDYFIKAYGLDHFSRISHALTRPPSYSCVRVNTLQTSPDVVVEKLMEIVRKKGYEFEDGPISKCSIPGLDYVLLVKGLWPKGMWTCSS